VVGGRAFVSRTGGMITHFVRTKPVQVTLYPPLNVKDRQFDADFTLLKTVPSKSEMACSVTFDDQYEGRHKNKTGYFHPSQSSFRS